MQCDWQQGEVRSPARAHGRLITPTVDYDGSYTVETSEGKQAKIAKKHLDVHSCPVPAPANHAVTYVSFAPALILAVLLLVNFLFTGLTSWVTEDEDREWWARSAAWILITIAGWIVVNAIVLWGAQAISATQNQLGVFLGDIKANPAAKAFLGAFGGVTGIVGALLALRSKLSKKLGRKVGSQWLLIVAAVVFFVLLAIVISWILLWLGSQPWAQHVTAWVQTEAISNYRYSARPTPGVLQSSFSCCLLSHGCQAVLE